jgi:predicted acyltransferase
MKKTEIPQDYTQATGAAINPALPQNRVASVDIYRGFVMLLMMAEVLSLSNVSKALPGNKFWEFISFNQSHVHWIWLSLHDMIQPSFTFLFTILIAQT